MDITLKIAFSISIAIFFFEQHKKFITFIITLFFNLFLLITNLAFEIMNNVNIAMGPNKVTIF